MATREFDLVLFGATGFTGRLVAEYLAATAPAVDGTLGWALAGRNREKLEQVRAGLTAVNAACADLPLEVVDAADADALAALAKRTTAVCTTVGPYLKYGQALAHACAHAGTHYCDLTGETPFIRACIDDLHAVAEKTGARIVHSCGFDSIPSDIGTRVLQEHAISAHGQPCQRVRLTLGRTSGGFSGGTAHSLLEVAKAAGDKKTRRVLADPYSLVTDKKRGPDRGDDMRVRYDRDVDGWVGPFLMGPVNTRIVRRSNALLDYRYGEDFSYNENMRTGRSFKSRMVAHGIQVGLGAVVGTAASGPGRALLNRVFPAPGEGPDEATRENGFFEVHIHGHTAPGRDDNAHVEVFVRGEKDPGYGETAKMLGESALCLALDDAKLKADATLAQAGVLTPASAMGMVLCERLRDAGMTFEVRS